MFYAIFLAIQQLNDPLIHRVVIRAVVVSAVIFTALVFGISWILSAASIFGVGWIDSGLGLLGGAAALMISLLIFPAFTGLIISFALEEIARSVDLRYFPDQPDVRNQSIAEIFKNAAQFAAIALGLNLLVLILIVPFLIFTVFLAPLIPCVFCALNGYLLGREYFEFAALRRLGPGAMRSLKRRHKIRIFMSGILIAVLMTIPLLNWLMPVVATAYMVHVFEYTRRRDQLI